MKMTIRWYGKDADPIPLRYLKQIPCLDGVVTSLLHIPAGEIWPLEEVQHMHRLVTDAGLRVEVIESVNIHEDIKLGAKGRDEKIEAYIETMKNLSKIGIRVICYNFMPVFDWLRSQLYYELADGSNTMFFEKAWLLQATPKEIAARYAEQSGGMALAGWEPERMAHVNETIARYASMSQAQYEENAKYFIDAIIPWAEKLDIKMAIHPDDPPMPVFGLPRLVNSKNAIAHLLRMHDSPYHGITLCTGSLGADPRNDLPDIIRTFADRIHFAHIRNLQYTGDGDFYESAHPSACGSFDMYAIMKALHDAKYDGFIRPDHGRMIWDEKGRAGYGLYDRALGIAYLEGLWEALERQA